MQSGSIQQQRTAATECNRRDQVSVMINRVIAKASHRRSASKVRSHLLYPKRLDCVVFHDRKLINSKAENAILLVFHDDDLHARCITALRQQTFGRLPSGSARTSCCDVLSFVFMTGECSTRVRNVLKWYTPSWLAANTTRTSDSVSNTPESDNCRSSSTANYKKQKIVACQRGRP